MEEIVYLDGLIYELKEAKINLWGKEIFNNVFESLIVVNKKILKLEEHLERLLNSAKILKMSPLLSYLQIKEAILFTLDKSKLRKAYLRVSIIEEEKKNVLIILIKKLPIYLKDCLTKGVGISFGSIQRNPHESLSPKIKCSNFLANILAKSEGVSKDNFEVISLNSQGLITEGTISNIFLVKDEVVYTPKKSVGILEGITRKEVLSICEYLNIKAKEEYLTRYDVYTANEVFLTFTSSGILPVSKIDNKIIKDGRVGKITKALLKEYRKRLNSFAK
ncbi:aminotransferase class IV [bacterium]|nr:aminotransferase class IV [bacterium]MBU0899625.1 aminotransferase class IV [bacterium]MBU1153527.1 aminotransferase class IV [bacterium]MBU1782385.1 aminotransferase class IV [bacterium]MBU2600116.1 aminotransferase class IV [bacterium]